MVKKEWIEWYVWDNIRARIIMERVKDKIVDFVVQLEINDKKWKPVIRYNYAHKKPHKDLISKNGKKKKLWLPYDNLNELINFAEKDLKENWRKYLKECGYNEIE